MAAAAGFKPQTVLPGQDVTSLVEQYASRVVILGNGLHAEGEKVFVVKPGTFLHESPGSFWVESHEKRYDPKLDDPIVGIIESRIGPSGYFVNVRGRGPALLPLLAFDGASKRNHPDLPEGTLVYARVASASIHIEPELSCMVESGARKDWTTGESQFGKLEGGMSGDCSLHLARLLLNDDCPVLAALSARVPFEIAVGLNGRFWVRAERNDQTIVIYNAILNSEFLKSSEIPAMIEAINEKLAQR